MHQIQEHLYSGLAIMDLVGHLEELNALWRRNSVAHAMRLAFHAWKAADDLLSNVAEDLQGSCCGGVHVPRPTSPGEEGSGTPPTVEEGGARQPS